VITAGFLGRVRFGFMINAKLLNTRSQCREKTTIGSALVEMIELLASWKPSAMVENAIESLNTAV
jgi:hypothetical protein